MHCDENGVLYSWFHGFMDHAQADELLEETPPGYFLVRVCQVFNGYALSYHSRSRVHHHRVYCTSKVGNGQGRVGVGPTQL